MNTSPNEQFQKDITNRMPVHDMWRMVWKWIFDEINCGIAHQQIMNNEIMKWKEVVDYQKKIRTELYGDKAGFSQQAGKNGNVIDEIEYNLISMAHFLVKNEMGLMASTKDTLRVHNIDYKRYVICKPWFPECQDPKAKEKADAALKQNMLDHPETYPKFNKAKNRIEGIK